MKKICLMAVAAMLMLNSCSQEKEIVKPKEAKASGESRRISGISDCFNYQRGIQGYQISVLHGKDLASDLNKDLNCQLEFTAICQPAMSSSFVDSVTFGLNTMLPSTVYAADYDSLVSIAHQQAQTGFAKIAYPSGATGAYVSSYRVFTDFGVPFPNFFSAFVTVTYKFCGESGGDSYRP